MGKPPVPPRVHAVDVAGPRLTTFCPSESQQRLQHGIKFEEIFAETDDPVTCKVCLSTLASFEGEGYEYLEDDPVRGEHNVVLRPQKERWDAAAKMRRAAEEARLERRKQERMEQDAKMAELRRRLMDEPLDADLSNEQMLVRYLPRITQALERDQMAYRDFNLAMRAIPRVREYLEQMASNRNKIFAGFDLTSSTDPWEMYRDGYCLAITHMQEFLNSQTLLPETRG